MRGQTWASPKSLISNSVPDDDDESDFGASEDSSELALSNSDTVDLEELKFENNKLSISEVVAQIFATPKAEVQGLIPYMRRWRLTSSQVCVLKNEFKQNPKWSIALRKRLSKTLNLSESQLYNWNWDQKKKLRMDMDDLMEESLYEKSDHLDANGCARETARHSKI